MAKNVITEASSKINQFSEINENFVKKLTLKGVTEKTIYVYTRNIAQISLFFNENPLCLKEKQLNDYLYHLKTTRTGETAFKHAIYSLRSLFELSGKKALKTKLPSIPQKERLPIVLSSNECKKLILTPKKMRDRFLIAFMYSAGLRINEVSRLKIQDIDIERMQIHVVQSKGNKDRYVPLSKYIAQSFDKYLTLYKPNQFLFNSCNGKKFSIRGIQRIFREALKLSGIKKNATSHTLRHSYATHLLENGTDLLTIKNVLGHKNIAATMVYLHVSKPLPSTFINPLDIIFNKH
jgi:integrase/recombinase XerD